MTRTGRAIGWLRRWRGLVAAAAIGATGISCAEYIASPEDAVTRRVRTARLSTTPLTLDDGASTRLTLELLDQFGVAFQDIPEGTTISWESGDTTRLTVTDDGTVTAIRSGVASVTALVRTLGVLRATALVTIRQVPDRLERVAGDAQTGPVGDPLPQLLAVRLLDRRGDPVPDAEVRFTFDRDAGGTGLTTARTDATGVARATWTLAERVLGAQRATAETPSLPGTTLAFGATARAGPVATLLAISGGGQTGAIETPLPQPLVARAIDRFGNPVAAASIAFAANAGQGTVTPAQATADADGRASATWTLGSTSGPVQAAATSGSAVPARFDATATAGAVTQVVASPRTVTLGALGATVALSAVPRDGRGNVVAGAVIEYRSLDEAIATVGADGTVTAVANGETRIIVTVQGREPVLVRDEVPVTVAQVPASVAVLPATGTVAVGATRPFEAVVRDAGGAAISSPTVTWSSSAPTVAAVSATGIATGVAAGTATITATVDGTTPALSGAATLTVAAASSVAVTITPDPVPTLTAVGAGATLTAAVSDGGTAVPGAAVTWTSLDPTVATVSATGPLTATATAVAGGLARIVATVQSVTPVVADTVIVPVQLAAAAIEIVLGPDADTYAFGTGPVTATLVVRDIGGGTVDVTADLAVDRPEVFGVTRTGPRTFTLSRGSGTGAVVLTATVGAVTATSTRTAMPLVALRDDGGPDASCSVRNGRVFCVGRRGQGTNPNAGFADGTNVNRVREAEVALPAGNWRQVGVGLGFACALDDLGRVLCWGANYAGQLGDATTTDRFLTPLAVSVPGPYVALDVGYEGFACAVRVDGVLHCWGEPANGRLGSGSTAPRLVPTPVNTSARFTDVSAGSSGACALATDGQGYCWGFGGTTGTGNAGDVLSPTPLATTVRFTQVVNGWFHGCGLATDGQAWCWGDQFVGQGGIGVVPGPQSAPQPVAVNGLTRYTELRVGGYFTCGRATGTGLWWCWGNDENGETGRGSVNGRTWVPTPATVLNARNPVRLGAVGDRYTCAVDAVGDRWCVGRNVALGTGILVDPVAAGRRTLLPADPLPIAQLTLARTPTNGNIVVGGTATIDATATDAIGGTVPASVPVTWSVADAAVLTLTSAGARQAVVTGAAPGGSQVTAQAEFTSATTAIDVAAPVPAAMVIVSGDAQSGLTGAALPQPIVVEVRDAGGAPLPGVTVSFTGSGSTTPSSATTDATGRVQTTWTLGPTTGGQSLTAQATGGTNPSVTVGATATLPGQTVALVNTPLVGVNGTQQVRVTLARPAPNGGVSVSLSSGNASVLSVAAPTTVLVASGGTTATFTVTGVAAGSATLTATTAGYTDGSLVVPVSTNTISVPLSLNAPFTRQTTLPITLPTPAPPGGTTLTVTSADPTRVTVLQQTVVVPQGFVIGNALLDGIGLGSTTVTVTGPNLATGTSVVTVTAALDVIETSATLNTAFSSAVITSRLTSGGSAFAAPSGGISVSLTARNPACVNVPTSVLVPQGQTQVATPLGYGGSAPTPCTTFVVATVPGFASDSMSVTVNPAPSSSFGGVSEVGSGTTTSISYNLQTAAPAGGVSVTFTSSDPTRLVLAPDATTTGTGSLTLTIPQGSSGVSVFYSGLEGLTTATTATISAAPAQYYTAPTPATVTIRPLGVEASGSTATTTLSADLSWTAWVGPLNAAGTNVTQQALRAGGAAVVVDVATGTPSVAVPVVGGTAGSPAQRTIPVGSGSTTFGVRGLVAGTTTVTATATGAAQAPVRAGYPLTVTVTAPAIFASALPTTLGAGLQSGAVSVSFAVATPSARSLTILSQDPGRLLVAPNATTVGTTSITIPIAAGATSATFVVAAVEGTTGGASLSLSMPDYATLAPTVTVVTPAVAITNMPTTRTVTAGDIGFEVVVGAPNGNGVTQQALRAGATALVVTLTASSPAIGTVALNGVAASPTSTTIAAGSSATPSVNPNRLFFRPLSAGNSTVIASIPGFTQQGDAIRTVTVSP